MKNKMPCCITKSQGLPCGCKDDKPMTLGNAVDRAAKHLPEGCIIDIQVEKDGYGVGLITANGRLQLDGGDGIISDINEGICIANGFGTFDLENSRNNVDNEKLIAKQALKIAEMEEEIKSFKESNKEIYGIIFCIGGPLNDNKLGYTHKQMVPFDKIAKLVAN